jgi:hypothetical protein
MFVRGKRNKGGTVSVQIIDKSNGSYRVIKTFGTSSDPGKVVYLRKKGIRDYPYAYGQTCIGFWSETMKEFVRKL